MGSSSPDSTLFLVPNLDPGHCGVGDYGIKLSKALASMNAPTFLGAWADTRESPQSSSGVDDSIICHFSFNPNKKVQQILNYLITKKIKRLVIQLSPFGFHPKGHAWHLIKLVKKAKKHNVQVDLMLHE